MAAQEEEIEDVLDDKNMNFLLTYINIIKHRPGEQALAMYNKFKKDGTLAWFEDLIIRHYLNEVIEPSGKEILEKKINLHGITKNIV